MYNKTTEATVNRLLEKLYKETQEYIEKAREEKLPEGETAFGIIHTFIEDKLSKEWTHVETEFYLAFVLTNQLYEQTNRPKV